LGERRFARHFHPAESGATTPIHELQEFSSDVRGSIIPTVPGPNGRSLAVGETFLAAARERAENWGTLQELAGVITPFTADVRARVETELKAAHEAALAALRADYEGRLDELRRSQTAEHATRLRERLLELAGYGAARRAGTRDEGTSS
jgi:pyruvate-ferredoxin/flavodoxin oxidoreductase